ncbi:hypothetical protein GCM10018790_03830 [Kitasatospora xanthocidica]|uniref:DUF6049 family protein n=1 Tax=Kitasatospora xanthocidica TaxID=83382 RepID=UPI001676D2A0|nr:DUF6049 family protein [Kitasatospora xanthocidica]GHF29591.1 hypothetical protein GCM10018790_03830 [Kitasatospora xanthocidica]
MSEPARHSGLGAHRQPGRAERPADGRHPVRRAGLRLAAACAAALTLFAASPAGALPAGGNTNPAADSTASAKYPVVLTIESLAPQVAVPNGTVTITGHVTNAGQSALKGAHAAVRKPYSGKPLDRRSDLAGVAGRSTPVEPDGVELDSPQYALPELNPGQTLPYTLSVAVNDLGLSSSGVYELAVDAWGSTADNSHDRALGIARSFLPYNPGGAEAQPTKLATLWPLVHAPVLTAQTVTDNDQSVPVLRDDSLATDLAPGGRLYELVDTGSKLPGLTWVVDPDLLDAALAMTKPYRVQNPGTEEAGKPARDDNTVLHNGSAAAGAWLDKLRAAVAKPENQVVALPYADPDLASIAHNGADLSGMATALGKAATAGRLTVEGRLSVDTRSDVAWPYQGYVDQQIVGLAQQTGSSLVLANGASMPEPDALNYTPSAARPIGNGQSAVVADETVSALFQRDLSTAKDQTESTQRFLAETFAITHEQPQNQRGLLVMPPRDLSVTTAKVLATALQAASGKWIAPVKLDAVAQSSPDPKATTGVPAATDYPTQARATELTSTELVATNRIQYDLDTLMRVLTLPQRVRGPFNAAMVRSLSTEWREREAAGVDYRKGVTAYLKELTKAVQVPPKKVVTLAGDTGLLQVSVRNDLTQTVTNLKLVLTSAQPNRLNVRREEELVLPASQSATLRFQAEAHNNGTVQMTAQLWTTGPNGRPYGEAQPFTVEVTSVTNGVLYVFAGAGVLLLLAALRFVRQRKRRDGQPHADGDQPVGDAPATGGAAAAEPTAESTDAPDAPEAADRPARSAGSTGDGPGDGDAGAGPAQTPRGSSPDGRDRAASDEKVGP